MRGVDHIKDGSLHSGIVAMKKVLVLSYYFPPLGLSGVQRTTKFVKYLPDFGWQPVVITARPGSYFAFDQTLLEDIPESVHVERTRSLDPTRWLGKRKTTSIPSAGKHGCLRTISNRMFFPDNKSLWVPFARKEANRILKEEDVSAIYSTAPPFSSHLLAVELAKKHDLPLVLDFRDNWVGNPREVFATPVQRRRHAAAEKHVLEQCDHAITINEYIREDFISRTGISGSKISIVEQGYDPDDFPAVDSKQAEGSSVVFGYSGVFYDAQKPDSFLHALARARKADKTVREKAKSVFVGLVPEYFSALVAELGLNDVVDYKGYLAHRKSINVLAGCDIPWLIVGNQEGGDQISTGKLGEYLGLGKPILGLVPEGAAKETLQQYGASSVHGPDDIESIADGIIDLVNRTANGNVQTTVNSEFVDAHNRRYLTGKLADILDTYAG